MLIHKKHSKAVFTIVILILALVTVVPVAAQGDDGETPPCEGDSVSGTIVAVDEEMVTIDTGKGLCVVTLDGGHDHPIIALLGSYFGGVSANGLAAALKTTQGCAVQDPDSGVWTWADCDAEGAVSATVVAVTENGDGTYEIELAVEGEEEPIFLVTDDDELADSLEEALDALEVVWELQVVDEEGTVGVVDASDEIATYHEDGLGFGVLAKLYAMAAKSGVPVEELVAAFQSGTGMGELFKGYGRPSILGIGHIKQQAKAKEHKGVGPPDHAGPKDDDADKGGGPPDHAGPKGDDADKGGSPPDRAGPKDDDADKGGGPPDHAGPKSDDADKGGGPPDHAGPKK